MNKRLARVKRDAPQLAEKEEVQQVATDIDTYAALRGFASSEAGQVLIEAELRECVSAIDALAGGAKTMTELDLRANAMKLGMHLEFVRSLTRASANLDYAESYLKEILST